MGATYFGFSLDEEDESLLSYKRRKEKEGVERVVKLSYEDGDGDDWEQPLGDANDGVGWRLLTLNDGQAEFIDRRKKHVLEKLA